MEEKDSRYGEIAVNLMNKKLWTASKGWFFLLGGGWVEGSQLVTVKTSRVSDLCTLINSVINLWVP